jgi:hypothetical protein
MTQTNSASLACFRGVAPTSNSGEKGRRCGNCQYQQERCKSESESLKSESESESLESESLKSESEIESLKSESESESLKSERARA